ncbi:lipopolysaccharide heptosyltransferase I [Iodobacter sp. LRB]|uniref:lipopolysaccharide heptosyltransferase I n=1 Tax=unclassified Iodobacter TaxID=235634 RepID=UPI000C10C675|nr:lipopolysaccharide heptosyltransferase I [Iodobacter sp. BJB302]PHV03052.1 lipopolysaccharide heptosyltransferase I [Iodobacter sp. BJB302]
MFQTLIIRLSSMGDIIHNFPALSDLARHRPDIAIDWVVEESFAALPALHPAIRTVIPTALRRWRKAPLKSKAEFIHFRRKLRHHQYDLIIDSQGLIKSAFIAKQAIGPISGYDKASAREGLASLAYQHKHAVPRNQHAILRNRQLSAQVFNYKIDDTIDYGLNIPQLDLPWRPAQSYAVLLSATSRSDKEWAEDNWIELGTRLNAMGISSVLPWGNAQEQERSLRLAAAIPNAVCPPRISLAEAASLLASSRIVVGVDTGLAHLAAAVAVPVVAIFCASDPQLTGVLASSYAINLGHNGAPPSLESVWQATLDGMK